MAARRSSPLPQPTVQMVDPKSGKITDAWWRYFFGTDMTLQGLTDSDIAPTPGGMGGPVGLLLTLTYPA